MSDSQQGPDWWQASDGKWYPPAPPPPSAWPDAPAPAPAPAGGNGGKIAAVVIGAVVAGTVAVAVLAILAITFLGRSSDEVDRAATLGELERDGEGDEMKQAARESLAGVFTASESDCIMDGLLQRDDLTAGQILDYAEAPGTGGPVEAAYVELVPGCVDPNATVDGAGPPSAEMRTGMIQGATAAGLTEDEATCMFDALIADGWTARDLTLAGYLPEREQLLTSAVERVAAHCFAGS